jgi:DNA primase
MKNTDIIKDKLNILDVVGSYVVLEKAGSTYKGTSPFTNEKTPSFFVSPEKGFFYCFSSGKGGDMFTFIQEIERVEFRDALKILAEKAGVSLSKDMLKNHDQNTLRYKILDDITKWYEIHLRKTSDVVDYLLGRGLTKETLINFRIGFALDDWSDAHAYLKGRKYTDADIESVGLIINKEGTTRYYDRFRSRVMFPLFDGRGRAVGFSGRIFTDDPEVKGAKYINSPEGPLFDKSKVLYGYHTAKSAMSKANACILVEGQFDVLMAQQAGYTHTVAVSGTGLTDPHIAMIKRFTDTVILAFDSDNAGLKATRRSALAAYRHGMNVRIVTMPENMDPADVIAHSKEQWDVCISDARDYIDYRLDRVPAETSFVDKKKLVYDDLFTFVSLMKSAITQDKVLQKLSGFLGVSVDSVRSDFAQFTPDKNDISKFTTENVIEVNPVSNNEKDNDQKDVLYFYSFLKNKNHVQNFKNFKNIEKIYKDFYTTDINDDYSDLEETAKNIQLFIAEEKYRDASEASFEGKLLTDIIDPYIKFLEVKKNKGIEGGRIAESRREYEPQQDDIKIKLLIEDLKSQRDNKE